MRSCKALTVLCLIRRRTQMLVIVVQGAPAVRPYQIEMIIDDLMSQDAQYLRGLFHTGHGGEVKVPQ